MKLRLLFLNCCSASLWVCIIVLKPVYFVVGKLFSLLRVYPPIVGSFRFPPHRPPFGFICCGGGVGGLKLCCGGGGGCVVSCKGGGGLCVCVIVSCGMFIFSPSLPPLSPYFLLFPFSLPSFFLFFLFFYLFVFVFRRMVCTGE